MRPRLARNWGSLLSPGCTSLFLSLCTLKALLHSLAPRTGTSLLLFPTAGQFQGIFSHPNVAAAASEATVPLSVPLLLLVCSWLCGLSLLFKSWILSTPRLTIKTKDGVAESPRLILLHQGAAQEQPALQEKRPNSYVTQQSSRKPKRPFAHITDFFVGLSGKEFTLWPR